MARMTRDEVVQRLCGLGRDVMDMYGATYAADCICETEYFRWETEIVEFMEKAVRKAIEDQKLLREMLAKIEAGDKKYAHLREAIMASINDPEKRAEEAK